MSPLLSILGCTRNGWRDFTFSPSYFFPLCLLFSSLFFTSLPFLFTLHSLIFWFLSFFEHNNNCCTKHTISKTNENHFKCWKYVYFKDSVIFFTSPHSISPLVSSIFPKKSMNYNCMVYLCFFETFIVGNNSKEIHSLYVLRGKWP